MEERGTTNAWSKSELISAIGLVITLTIIISGAIGLVTMMQTEAQQTKKSIDEIRSLMREYEIRRDQRTEKLTEEIKNIEIQITEIRATQRRAR